MSCTPVPARTSTPAAMLAAESSAVAANSVSGRTNREGGPSAPAASSVARPLRLTLTKTKRRFVWRCPVRRSPFRRPPSLSQGGRRRRRFAAGGILPPCPPHLLGGPAGDRLKTGPGWRPRAAVYRRGLHARAKEVASADRPDARRLVIRISTRLLGDGRRPRPAPH
jgi:hypothetical protein